MDLGLIKNVIHNSSPLMLLGFSFLEEGRVLLALTILHEEEEDLISGPGFE